MDELQRGRTAPGALIRKTAGASRESTRALGTQRKKKEQRKALEVTMSPQHLNSGPTNWDKNGGGHWSHP